MIDLSTKRFSDIIFEKLSELNYGEPILTNPQVENVFPLLEIHTPLKSINKFVDGFPISSDFQIQITCWNESQRNAMDMIDEVDFKLQLLNFNRTQTTPAQYDAVLKKYGITITLEVRYNAITNSFILRR